MKKITLLFLFALSMLSSIQIKAQNINPIKEHYDKIYTSIYSPSNIDYSNCSVTGNGLSWVLK